MRNFYSILEIPNNATDQVIKHAYRKLVKQWHPDRHQGSEIAQSWFREVREAYETLSNNAQKQIYDIRLKKAKIFRRVVNVKKPTLTVIPEEPATYSFEELQEKLALLTRQHKLHVKDNENTAEYYRNKKQKDKTFYDTFRENREQAYQEMKG